MNKDRKQRYISEHLYERENLEQIMTYRFDAVEPYEEELGKDLADFSLIEIMIYYMKLGSYSIESLITLNSDLGRYTNWCLTEGLIADMQNHYLEITNEMLYKCSNKMLMHERVFTRKELIANLNKNNNANESLLVMAAFEGLCAPGFKDIFYLCEADLDENDVVTTSFSKRKLHVSVQLAELIKEAATTYSFQKKSRVNECIDQYNHHECFKTTKSKRIEKLGENSRDAYFARLFKQIRENMGFDKNISVRSLNLSGLIFYIRKFMAEDESNSLEDTIRIHKDEIEYRYGKILSIPRFIMKYGDLFKVN